MPVIDPNLYLSAQTTERTPNPSLGKEEFLKILMAQLQYQDPLNPLDDREFIAQMTTFSSLEQLMNMSKSIDKLVQNQSISPVISNSHMIGKKVTYKESDEESEELSHEKSSVVIAVSQEDGLAVLELENDEKIYADEVIRIQDI